MSEKKLPANEAVNPKKDSRDSAKVCGIVMPIASMGEAYPEEHWRRVLKILQRAITMAGMRPQLVWENPEVDVIQSAILQNIYESEVVICDVSGLNPNVMLETGLRLSTKKPTVIVTDKVHRPPFDIGTIGYIDYQFDLEFNAIDDFIGRLSRKIQSVSDAYDSNSYVSFVENYQFETVTPTTVNVSETEYVREKLTELTTALGRLERSMRESNVREPSPPRPTVSRASRQRPRSVDLGSFVLTVSQEQADEIEAAIDDLPGCYCLPEKISETEFEFTVKMLTSHNGDKKLLMERAFKAAQAITM